MRRNRQVRIGPGDGMTLEEAREAIRQIRSRITEGFDPRALARKQKEVPVFKEFVENQYLPHVKMYKHSWDQDEKMIDNHIIPLWNKAKLTEITRERMCRDFRKSLLRQGTSPAW